MPCPQNGTGVLKGLRHALTGFFPSRWCSMTRDCFLWHTGFGMFPFYSSNLLVCFQRLSFAHTRSSRALSDAPRSINNKIVVRSLGFVVQRFNPFFKIVYQVQYICNHYMAIFTLCNDHWPLAAAAKFFLYFHVAGRCFSTGIKLRFKCLLPYYCCTLSR